MRNDNTARKSEKSPHEAGAILADQLPSGLTMISTDPRRLLHELEVHRIELQMQNEELRGALAELDASRSLYFELYDLAPIGYCTLSEEGRVLKANLAMAALCGIAPDELVNHQIQRFIQSADHEHFDRHLQRLGAEHEQSCCDLRMVKSDGSQIWVRLRSVSARDADGNRYCRTAFADVTETKRAEEALREQEDFFHQIAENLSDFIAVLDLEGRRIYNSPSYEQFFGPGRDLRDSDSFAEIHPDDRERVREVFRETVQTGVGHQIEYRFIKADGSVRDMESRGSVIEMGSGKVRRVLVVSRDITERKCLQEQVRQMAFHDVLTGLPNRRLFGDRLGQAMAVGTRSACYGALMFIDLDNFKPLNDIYGHDIGDLFLIETAGRLSRCVREMDTVARFGGDEFVVMLSQLDWDQEAAAAQAAIVAEKLLAALSEPFRLPIKSKASLEHGDGYRCTASIGVTLFNDREQSPSCILKRADAAMYQAKQAGGNQIRFCAAKCESLQYRAKLPSSWMHQSIFNKSDRSN